MSTKFVREGMESDRINDTFYLTDWLTVLHVYKKLKEEEGELPSLIPRNDFSEIPVEVAEELDDVIMHDPLIKKAIGNVAIEIFMRDQKVSEEEAYEKAKEMLPDFMGDFEQFIGSVATLALKQITSKAGKHGIHVTDVRERLTPKVSEIGAFGIKLHFAQPDSSSTKRDYSNKKDSDLDTMYG
jgi:hypothetical protein